MKTDSTLMEEEEAQTIVPLENRENRNGGAIVADKKAHTDRFSRNFLLAAVLIVVVLFFHMIQPFLLPVLLAAVFTTLFYPMYAVLLRLFSGKRNLAALAACLILLIGLMVPVYLVANVVGGHAIDFFRTVERQVAQPDSGALGSIRRSAWFHRLGLDHLDWQSILQNTLGSAGELVAGVISKTSGGAFYLLAHVFVTFFIMFYFFRDGPAIVGRIRSFIPMNDEYVETLISRFVTVSRATIKGLMVIGIVQSTLGALILWATGVPSPTLWWLVMLVLSMIPVFGAWMVMHPVALVQILIGHVWQGVVIFLATILLISTIDNVLRPRLVGHFTGLHDLLIFLSALGGIAMFGPMGVFVGPIIAAFCVTLLDIYRNEFRSTIHVIQQSDASAGI